MFAETNEQYQALRNHLQSEMDRLQHRIEDDMNRLANLACAVRGAIDQLPLSLEENKRPQA